LLKSIEENSTKD